MLANEIRSWRRDIVAGVVAIATVMAALLGGQLATTPALAPWYASLIKPAFNPPTWLFVQVWTTLYALMTYAAFRVLRMPAETPGRTTALILFFAQLALNAAWPWMFFGAQSPALGLLNIVPQLALIIAATAAFWRINRLAAFCLMPVAAWVAFATLLNFAIWWLNR